MVKLRSAVLVVLHLALITPAGAQNSREVDAFTSGLTETQTLNGLSTGPGAPGDRLGLSMAIVGNQVLVAAPERTNPDCQGWGGALYVFDCVGGFCSIRNLLTPSTNPEDYFGTSLAADGGTAVVGSPEGSSGGFLFERQPSGDWVEAQVLSRPTGWGSNTLFGEAVAVGGDSVAVGAPQESQDDLSYTGAVHVYTRLGSLWEESQRLVSSDLSDRAKFGSAIAIDGDTMLVGAPSGLSVGFGAVYVFSRVGDTWVQTQQLSGSDAAPGDRFGAGVAIRGDTAMVGAPDAFGSTYNTGAIYVFSNSGGTWSEVQKIFASDGSNGEPFGWKLALGETDALVYGNQVVYAFVKNGDTWEESQIIHSPNDPLAGLFGLSLGLDGDIALIGAPEDSTAGSMSGTVFRYSRSESGWIENDRLLGLDGFEGDSFGAAVARWGTTALIGAPDDENGTSDLGAAYFFQLDDGEWLPVQKVVAADTEAESAFGSEVAIFEDTALITAPGESLSEAVYVFSEVSGRWTHEAKLEAPADLPNYEYAVSEALWGDTAFIGAFGAAGDLVLVYERVGDSWGETQRLAADGDDSFGVSVAAFGSTIAVGASGDDTYGSNAGAVHLFTNQGGTWVWDQTITAGNPVESGEFGWRVGLWDDLLVVTSKSPRKVAVYRSIAGTWTEEAELESLDSNAKNFGDAVVVSPGRVVVGASMVDYAGGNSGSAYTFVWEAGSWHEAGRVVSATTEYGDHFGYNLASWFDSVMIGAPSEDSLACDSGSVHHFLGERVFSDGFEAGDASVWN